MKTSRSAVRRGDIGWIILGILLAAAAAYYFFPRATPLPSLEQATLLTDAKPVPEFSLVDHQGRPFDRQSLSGGWNLLFFGYTHCPDVCPTTLQTLASTSKEMRDKVPQAALPRVVFISVDPARDTLAQLAKYVTYFNPAFLGVTGDPAQIEKLASQMGILFARLPEDASGDYLVDHSASVLLVDPDGNLRALFSPPQRAEAMAADIPAIQDYYEAVRR
jgi:protein SCO1